MALDSRVADPIARRMGNMYLTPGLQLPNYSITPSPGTSPGSNRYLPPAPSTGTQPMPIPIPIPGAAPGSHNQALSISPNNQALTGTSPRYVPPILPPYSSPTSSIMSPPPAYGSSPSFSTAFPAASSPTYSPNAPPPRVSRLAPDSKGMEIPLDAKWTKIRRTLVSPEILEKAGVRYEARPDFVAVLGVLSREQIALYARQSDEVRNARRRATGPGPSSDRGVPTRYPDERKV